MKLSLNWLKRYLKISYTPEKIAEMLTLIGLEVEGIDKVESIKGGLKGVVTGHVVTCEKHPDADRLSLTTVQIGVGDPLQIVCGAPNVAAGQKVMVATIGTVIYNDDGTSFTIKKGKIRGVESQGMICAEDELGIGHDHSGIIVLPAETPIGMPAAQYFKVEDDYVFEVGLTPNRSDATSQFGIARDLLAYLKVNENFTDELKDPDISGFITERIAFNIDVELEDKVACPRYTGISIANVTVKESPDWMKKLLQAIGVKPINNIVDATNFVLNEIGQPLHAFDADKIAGRKVIVTKLSAATPFTTLDGVERKLGANDLMICDGNRSPLTIAGVYGGLNSGVTEETKNVFLESACFNATAIRKTSTLHNLRTDAAKVFEKGSDPNNTEFAIKRAASLIKELAGGEISNIIVDEYPKPIKMVEIRLNYAKVHQVTGVNIPAETIHTILQSMEMEIEPLNAESILVKVPTNKVDVIREIDLIEEIIRIYGLNRVEVPSRLMSTITYSTHPDKHKTKELISDFLSSRGFNEMMGLSLIESRFYDGLNITDADSFVAINNTSNVHLDIMRPEMLLSGLQSVAYNLNRQQQRLALYEFGKSYLKRDDGHREQEYITLFLTGKKNEESWLTDAKSDRSFYDIKRAVLSILERLGINDGQFTEITDDKRFSYGLSFDRGPITLATFGEVSKTVLQKVGIKVPVFYAELLYDNILMMASKAKTKVNEISKFPSMRRDLALVVDKNIPFSDIEQTARKAEKKLLKQITLFDVYINDQQLGENKKSYAVSFMFENPDKTLNDKEIDQIMTKITAQLEEKTKAFIRK